MPHNWIALLSFISLSLSVAPSSLDLLDEYVQHIENVNRLNHGYDHSVQSRSIKPHQRHRRSVESNEQISSEHAEIASPSVTHSKDKTFTHNLRDFHNDDVNSINSVELPSAGREGRSRRDAESVEMNPWTHCEVLDKDGDLVLRWQPRHKEILFRVEARTKGYVGIGFSPDGGMAGADIVVGWVDDRSLKTHLLDCHGIPSQGSAPVRDEVNNYTLLKGSQNDTHTVLEFKRVLDTCDPDDYVLTGDTVRIIWALHDNDPKYEEELVYHGERRGSQSVHLMGPPPPPKTNEPHVRQWDVTLKNFEVKNNMDTIYWCKIFKAPALNDKNHIIGYEPLIGDNHTTHVHHMILHECYLDGVRDLKRWNEFANENGCMCYGPDMPMEWVRCLTPLVAWAVGSKGENYPENVGVPLDQKNPFYMLEVHFDNPSMKRSRDTSGLRLHYTEHLREHEAGVFATGVTLSTLHFIPPYQSEYKTAGYCSFDCTKSALPKDGINVVSVMLHSHLAGRKMKLRHIRAGKELQPLAEDNRYDFNYQQARNLPPNTKLLPGDGLITECTYSTVDRKKPTLGGYSTSDEMCLSFVLHYPRTHLAGCSSMPPIRYFVEILGVKEFYGYNMTDVENLILQGENEIPVSAPTPSGPLFPNNPGDADSPEANKKAILALMNAKEYIIEGETSGLSVFDKLVIKEPREFQNKTFTSHLQDIPYNETLITKKMEEFFYKGLHFTFCRKRDDTPAGKETVEQFPNFTSYVSKENQVLCSYKHRRSSSVSMNTPNLMLLAGILTTVLSLSSSVRLLFH